LRSTQPQDLREQPLTNTVEPLVLQFERGEDTMRIYERLCQEGGMGHREAVNAASEIAVHLERMQRPVRWRIVRPMEATWVDE
jgi:hypothetical protein